MLFLQRLGPAVLPPRDVCVRMSPKVHLSIGFSFHACLSPSVVVPLLLRIDEKQQSGSSSGRSSVSKVLSRLFKGFQAEDAKTRCFLFASLPRDCVLDGGNVHDGSSLRFVAVWILCFHANLVSFSSSSSLTTTSAQLLHPFV